jgi:hypothetical protein
VPVHLDGNESLEKTKPHRVVINRKIDSPLTAITSPAMPLSAGRTQVPTNIISDGNQAGIEVRESIFQSTANSLALHADGSESL